MPRSPQSYRLGFGEVTTPKAERAMARAFFLLTLRQLYPKCFDDLLALLPLHEWDDHSSERARCRLETTDAHRAVVRWARQWNLLDRGSPPGWLIEVAWHTLCQARLLGFRDWAYPWAGGAALSDPAERDLGTCGSFNPEFHQAGPFKRRLRAAQGDRAAEACWQVDKIVSLALRRGGKLSEWKCEPAHFQWAVRLVAGRESYESIASTPYHVTPEAVKAKVLPLLRTIGLVPRKPGRPRKQLS